jgi:microcin C transport system ATP-binding protein
VEYGDAADIFQAPQKAYTQELLSAALFYQNNTTTN